ncbi:histidine--tRNA ligase [Lacisediminihabitans profunda]|uniref:Histidine--tRNA ligase n=1 Tax=Lacisediminihabitans profunda TaxID=2594790 RepID=A0A5C8UTZ8_9MICO|nr:histidine--tRNA ligase [Lacisediminihabitans profunda]TXN31106.1 histidine--tRNA ligase [Lacisediminihabitans profunda]
MASPVNPPRGMRDFLPDEKARREHVLSVIRTVFSAHGFDEIETPVMEDSARLHAGLGGDNEKLAFGVLKRGLTTEDIQAAKDALDLADLGLRFDLTVPLARFYATHRAELPTVFRAIQIAPVWRAERPQKGRYRQFVQCDIDIIGEAGPLAEIELLTATAATMTALGLADWTIRVNDRRLLIGMLDTFGFDAADHDSVLVTIDKLDKVGPDGVVAELRAKGAGAAAVDALDAFFRRPQTLEYLSFGERAIAKALPPDADPAVIAELAAIGRAVNAGVNADVGAGTSDDAGISSSVVEFDPFLVRGMGYYTGTIFEIAHPASSSSLGGGGRYDGMIGRFLGSDVPAAGFSIGFERIVDLVELPADAGVGGVALVYDTDVAATTLMHLKSELIASGRRVRLERAPRNIKPLLEQLVASGFTEIATVPSGAVTVAELKLRKLGAE